MAGHIRQRRYKTKSGTTTRYRARYPDPAGDGTAQIEKTFKTRREAEAWLTRQGAALLTGTHVDPRLESRPFREVVEAWKGRWVKLGPKTRGGYESILNRYLLPEFGHRKVGEITTPVVQAYITRLAQTDMAPGTVRGIYSVLRSAMGAGVKLGMVRVNPCAGVELPSPSREKMLYLTPDEVRALAEAIDPHYRTMIYTAAYTGLRAGELGGLRRKRLDPLRGKLHVEETLKDVGLAQAATTPTR